MSFHIKAWLEKGIPQLQIIDAESKSVCMSWSYANKNSSDSEDKIEVQELFRQLVLLTCKQKVSNGKLYKAIPLLDEIESY